MPHASLQLTRLPRALALGGAPSGDPAGSPDRVEFEAAGLNLCVDKTPEGLDVVLAEMARLLSEPALTPL